MVGKVAFAYIKQWIDFEKYEDACKFIEREDNKRIQGKKAFFWDGDGEDILKRPTKPYGYSGDSEHDYNRFIEYRNDLKKYYDSVIYSYPDEERYVVVAYKQYKDYETGK